MPQGGDVYVLSQILHDWDDESCHRILVNARRAMREEARLVIAELVLPARGAEPISAFMDLNMMAVLTGKERTETEFAALLGDAGFRLLRALPTRAPQRILEAAPA